MIYIDNTSRVYVRVGESRSRGRGVRDLYYILLHYLDFLYEGLYVRGVIVLSRFRIVLSRALRENAHIISYIIITF